MPVARITLDGATEHMARGPHTSKTKTPTATRVSCADGPFMHAYRASRPCTGGYTAEVYTAEVGMRC